MGLVAVSIGSAASDPLIGATFCLLAGYTGYGAYDWAMNNIVEGIYERPIDLGAENFGHLIGGIVGGISIVFGI
jgi:hypothetical protein